MYYEWSVDSGGRVEVACDRNMSNREQRQQAGPPDRNSAGPLSRCAAALAGAVLVAACHGGVNVPGDQANERLTITNTQFLLNARVAYPNQPVPVDSDPTVGQAFATARALSAAPVLLTLITEIDPPIVDGEVVQATSISLDGADKAMVSYNMRGAPRLGAIDYITKLTDSFPVLSSEVLFNDSDISAVTTDGTYVYAAVATDDAGFTFPSAFERIKIENDKFTLQDNMRIPLTSFAGTSAMRTSNEIYATSGDEGDVFAFTKSDLDPLGQFPLHDARWVAWDKDGGRVIVAQGTPGQISVFAEGEFPGASMNLLNTFPFPGADVPQSKSTVDIAGGKAFIAAGPDGVQVVCLDDGQIVGSVPRPDPASLGLDPSVVVTNAVAVDKDLMFISNGEAGVYVAQGNEVWKDTACTAQQQITVLGQLQFNSLQSVNHVEYKNDHLIIAAGLGGVKVVRVTIQ